MSIIFIHFAALCICCCGFSIELNIFYKTTSHTPRDTHAQRLKKGEYNRNQVWAVSTHSHDNCLHIHITYKFFARKKFIIFSMELLVEMLTFFLLSPLLLKWCQCKCALSRSKLLEWAFCAFESNSFLTFCLFFLLCWVCAVSLSLSYLSFHSLSHCLKKFFTLFFCVKYFSQR